MNWPAARAPCTMMHAGSIHGPLMHSLKIFQISVVNKVAVVKVVEEVVVNMDNELLVDDGTCKW